MKYLNKACAFISSPRLEVHGTRISRTRSSSLGLEEVKQPWGNFRCNNPCWRAKIMKQGAVETLSTSPWDAEHLCWSQLLLDLSRLHLKKDYIKYFNSRWKIYLFSVLWKIRYLIKGKIFLWIGTVYPPSISTCFLLIFKPLIIILFNKSLKIIL